MSYHALSGQRSMKDLFRYFIDILAPERSYYVLAIIYGIGISVLSLATPVSVQMLINTIANTGLTAPLVMLSVTLFVLLLFAGLLNALRIHLMDLFARRFYARMVSEIALRAIYALNPFFDDSSKGPLFNRYFDIVIVLKSVPNLLVGGFTIVLQAVVGFVLVSLYHPLFLVFNLVVILLVWITWMIWGRRAIRSAVHLSNRKHATAAWLEGLAASNGFFKTDRHIDEALERTDAVTSEYIHAHERHFRHHFSQTLSFLFIYAAGSAALLGLGGWLVIRGELSLGQLVAAELVLSVVLFGIAQMGVYLTYLYDLTAAIEELSLFDDVEQESPSKDEEPISGDASLTFVDASGESRGMQATLSLRIPSRARVLARAENHNLQRLFTNFMKAHDQPRSGYISLGATDIRTVKAHNLRRQVIVIDRPNAVEMTIRGYLLLSSEGATTERMLHVIRTVGLETTVSQLEQGLDTPIAATGWPLSITETMQLKLAAAVLAKPRILILNQIFDVMPESRLRASLELLQSESETTVICFSNRYGDLGFDYFLNLGQQKQTLHRSFDAMLEAAGGSLDIESAWRSPISGPRRPETSGTG
jgi:ABC-type bacteriocin/lantibiotic exporter with double-glycine peptidase domain